MSLRFLELWHFNDSTRRALARFVLGPAGTFPRKQNWILISAENLQWNARRIPETAQSGVF